jgi:ABC-type Fe3+/spermidine/putrescine transport system ATPase subunit
VFQQLALFPHLDVFDNIAFGPRVKGVASTTIASRVGAMLELVGLAGYERRRIAQLSGGQQQRVAIARALINEPAVLLLDEPLGALDLKLRVQMQRELKAIQHRVGTTFVYVTHDQSEALTMSDRMAVMNGGRVEQIGSGQELYLHPATTFVATFLGETNLLRGRVVGCDGAVLSVDVHDRLLKVAHAAAASGEEVTLSARPERLALRPFEQGAADGWRGRVADSSFLGNTVRYEVMMPWNDRLKIDRLAGDGPMLAPGQEVWVTCEADAGVVVGVGPG